MKKLLSLLLACSIMLCGCSNQSEKTTIKIGVLQLMTHEALNASLEGFKDGLKELGYEEDVDVSFEVQNGEGDQVTLSQMAIQLVDNQPDLLLAIGTTAAQSLQAETKDIPILGTAITDYVDTKLVNSNEKPGGNITGTSDGCPMDKQIDLLQKLAPNAKNVGILYTSSEPNSEIQAKQAEAELRKRGLNPIIKTVAGKNEINDTMESFVGKIEALYIPTDNNIASAMASVDLVASAHQIISVVGCNTMCGDGGAASMGVDYYKLGKQTAIMADKILKGGANVSECPIETLDDLTYYYNSDVLKKLNISWPSDLTGIDYYGYKS